MKKLILNEEVIRNYRGTIALDLAEKVIDDYGEDYMFENIDLDLAIHYTSEFYFMYDDDKWDLLKEYCCPDDPNWCLACDRLMLDLSELILEVEDEDYV